MTPDTKHRERPDFDSDWSDEWHRAWISPQGDVHPLTHRDEDGGQYNQTHYDFADAIDDDGHGPGQTWDGSYRKLLKDGWIRKVSHRSYHVGHESAIPKVLDHLRKHHPDVELARVMVHPSPVLRTQREHLRYLTKDGEVYEATAPPTSIQWGDPRWFKDREHAWITPDNEYIKLPHDYHHFEWAVRNGKDFHRMLSRGWVRKADKAIYQVGDKDEFHRVFAHVADRHPDVKRLSITHPMDYGGLTMATMFNKVGDQWHPEKNESEEPVHAGPAEIRAIAKRAKLDISRHDMKQLVMGVRAETEHDKPGDTDIIKGSKTARAEKLLKVALAHVREKGDYYTRLKKVEEGAGRGNWLDNREAGWIAPDDTYHQLPKGSVHDLWIKNNGNLLASTGVKPDAFGYDKRAIIAAGWIQKHGENVYSAHDRSAVPRVVKHFTERHPGVKRAMISFKTGGNVYVTRDGTVREPVPYRAEESVGGAPAPSRAWIRPTGEVHRVGGDGRFQTHQNWAATDQMSPLRNHPSTSANPFGVVDRMIERGWVRKGDRDSYEARSEKLPLIHAHFTKHHPDRRAVHVVLRDKVSPDSYGPDVIHLLRDGSQERCKCDAFYSIESVNENWMATRQAAWISPEDEEHPLVGGQFHAHWVDSHRHLVHPSLHRGAPFNSFETEDAMIKEGNWIKKQDTAVYHAGPKALGRVHAYFTKHHPELEKVHVYGAGRLGTGVILHKDGSVERPMVYESWSLENRKAAWLSPEGHVHPLEKGKMHLEWPSVNRDKLPHHLASSYWDTMDRMLDAGWVKKQHKDIYYTHDLHRAKDMIVAHVKKHHPEVVRVRITTPESSHFVETAGVNESWMHSRHAAWIDPEDNVHPLEGGQFHTDWVRANTHRIPAAHKSFYGHDDRDGLDAYATRDKMLGAGWIRKQDANIYNTGDLSATRQRIIDHVKKHHPGVMRVRVNEPSKDSWLDIDHDKVDEAWRGGPLSNWLAKRTAGWIAPDHTYHQLNPGEHHREWSVNPRNSRHLRDVLGVIDPARHWDANVVQHEMMKQGWIRKLDHDQYLVGRRSMITQALRHHERFHPHKNRVEVAVENYPTQGSMHRFYFQRDPNTREIMPRRDWREKRRLRKSQQDQKWGSSA